MGYIPEILHIIIFLLIIAASLSNAAEDLIVERVSGLDESEVKEATIVQKFRALLGMKSFHRKNPANGENVPPSPSPSPDTEAPAPTPEPPHHAHLHPLPSHTRPKLEPYSVLKNASEDGGKKRILVAVLGSAGAASVICLLGFLWGCIRLKKQRKKALSDRSKQNKVSLSPNMDLFYLNSLGVDLETPGSCLKQNSEPVSTMVHEKTPNCALQEVHEEPVESRSDNSSSTREILSVHEDDAESINYESDGDKIIRVESHSSDDESFHSLCDSVSSKDRFSNASAGSNFSEASEIFPSNVLLSPAQSWRLPPPLPPSPLRCSTKIASCSSTLPTLSTQPFLLPPPPPPPPSCSTKIEFRTSCSSILPALSSPRNKLKHSPESDLPCSTQKPTKQPSQVQSSIPPPPCPSQFPKGSTSSVKGPPPPPLQFSTMTPLGKDGSPLPKLKPLHWDKVRATPDRSMVWDKLRSSSFEFDEEMIESLFGYNVQCTNDELKNKTPSPGKHILDPKRLQNITILSKALNMPAGQVFDALLQGDGVALQQLEALSNMVPTKEEEDKLCSYKGDIKELGSAEQFLRTMLDIPFAFLRIQTMLYRETFEDEVVHLRRSFSMLEEACKELRSSKLFLKLLEAVLKTGNRMNVGTIRGGARAFKLDALLKLADVKGTDGKTTLLHFVVQEIIRSEGIRVSDSIMGMIETKNKHKTPEEKEEDYRRMGLDLVSGLSIELYNVKKTATIDLDVLASSVSNLSEGMAKLKTLIYKDLCNDQISENFVVKMKSFVDYADNKLKELQEDENRVLLQVKEITEYFHGDLVSRDDPNQLRIFVIVRDFMGMLDSVCKELRSFKSVPISSPLAPFR